MAPGQVLISPPVKQRIKSIQMDHPGPVRVPDADRYEGGILQQYSKRIKRSVTFLVDADKRNTIDKFVLNGTLRLSRMFLWNNGEVSLCISISNCLAHCLFCTSNLQHSVATSALRHQPLTLGQGVRNGQPQLLFIKVGAGCDFAYFPDCGANFYIFFNNK